MVRSHAAAFFRPDGFKFGHMDIKIKNALISVYHKDGLEEILGTLQQLGVTIYSTGGTARFIESLGIPVKSVESLTGYPSILGGRVKTLHPKVFGGILARRQQKDDLTEAQSYEFPLFDLVIVDLYPFEQTVALGKDEQEIIEKIDIGGISLIRAAAKNFHDVLIVSHQGQYDRLLTLLNENKGVSSAEIRRSFAAEAFHISANYDTAIFNWMNSREKIAAWHSGYSHGRKLRYGENPHQEGFFFGDFDRLYKQLHGKEISYNNLLDIDAAEGLVSEFNETVFAILKHNNACGLAARTDLKQAWLDALAGDPVSAFGGILSTNVVVDADTALEINKIFFEVIIAPGYDDDALEILKQKKNRIILVRRKFEFSSRLQRSALNGILVQDRDTRIEQPEDLKCVTQREPSSEEIDDLLFANKIVKHSKSNAIVLVRNKQLIGSGIGQTSRVDALKQAVAKAGAFKLDLKGAVMASDAFFPFADSVEIADQAGIKAVIQPGGSIRDKDSIGYCNEHGMAMVFTGIRHFKH